MTTAPNITHALEHVESHLHPHPSYLVTDHPHPTGLEEIWRFTPLPRFAALLAEGGQVAGLSWQGDVPTAVRIDRLSLAEYQAKAVEAPVDRVSAIAVQRAQQATHITVDAESVIAEPVVFTGSGQGEHAAEVLLVEVGHHASVTLVLHFTGSGSYACKYDIRVGDGAQVNLVYVNDWEPGVTHGGQLDLEIGRDARVRTVQASVGGSAIRLAERFRYAGTGGELEAYGIYFVDGEEHVQHRIFVDHTAPRTKSDVDYRGALQGKGSHAVWVGDVLIRKIAEGINTFESNKNLVLTEGCRADSVPNLEIQTGEVEDAGHASSTGRFDDEQLFYLCSRGVPEEEARRLIVYGFFLTIIRRVGVEYIEQQLLEQVEQELAKALNGKGHDV
ncbi:MAG: Fe-S cluster assembly protein SufD [Arachnia propionica]|nr:MAG: Fe-S cluster assembly protein SufD [Arachnia propionica]